MSALRQIRFQLRSAYKTLRYSTIKSSDTILATERWSSLQPAGREPVGLYSIFDASSDPLTVDKSSALRLGLTRINATARNAFIGLRSSIVGLTMSHVLSTARLESDSIHIVLASSFRGAPSRNRDQSVAADAKDLFSKKDSPRPRRELVHNEVAVIARCVPYRPTCNQAIPARRSSFRAWIPSPLTALVTLQHSSWGRINHASFNRPDDIPPLNSLTCVP